MTLFLITTIILFKSYFGTDGCLSPDSTHYLALAQSLLDGNGMYTSSHSSSQDLIYFAIWPAGYPTLIAILSKLTGISVFWSSKLVNIILITGILLVFLKLFGKSAYAYGFILLFGSYIEIYSYTWSEAPFIFGLVIFAASISNLIKNQSSRSSEWFFHFLGVCLTSLILFFSRYIGAFSTGVIGILSLYFIFIKRNLKIGSALVSILILNGIIIFLYLYNNSIKTGYSTGIPRIPSPETNFELAHSLLKSFFSELIFPVANFSLHPLMILVLFSEVVILMLIAWFTRTSVQNYLKNRKIDTITVIFFLIGIIYLISIIMMRWLVHFDGFSFRLIAPGTFLIFISVLHSLELSFNKKHFRLLSLGILVIGFIAIFCQALYPAYKIKTPSYLENIEKIKADFKNIEARSFVVFGNKHLNYLRPDISVVNPKSLPYSNEMETLDDFLGRLGLRRHIYIQVPEKISDKKYHDSIIEFVQKYRAGEIIKIR
ncbi:MAG: hypothetical protein WBQ37_11875 [Candidatus Competibacter sp.]